MSGEILSAEFRAHCHPDVGCLWRPAQPPPSGCTPSADQVALFVDIGYSGQCVVKSVGDYRNPGEIGLPNDSISSLRVGANVKCKIAVKIEVTFSMFDLESIYGLGF